MPDPIEFKFDYRDPNAIEAAEKYAAQFVTRITAEIRIALRVLVTKGIREGIPPAKLARLIRGAVGLNSRQAAALLNYRSSLEAAGVLKAAKIESLVSKYFQKLLRARELMIARTETMDAVNAGRLEAAKQSQRKGWLRPGTTKEWFGAPPHVKASRGGTICKECAAVKGERVPLDKPFSNGLDRPPAHPHCRCSLKIHPG